MRDALTEAGYAPVVTGNHLELAKIVRAEKPALVLLDLVLPGADGIELMQTVPELARQPGHIHLGLRPRRDRRAGAGSGRGRLHRQAVLADPSCWRGSARHCAAMPTPSPSCWVNSPSTTTGAWSRWPGARSSSPGPNYELLRALSLDAGRVVTYEALLDGIWSERRNVGWKVVRAFVKQLRAKLGDSAADPVWIFNVRGVGYRMPRPGEVPGA